MTMKTDPKLSGQIISLTMKIYQKIKERLKHVYPPMPEGSTKESITNKKSNSAMKLRRGQVTL